MDHRMIIVLSAAAVFYVAGTLFMRNTRPFSGSRKERWESKQTRRRIGTVLLVGGTLCLGIAGLLQLLIYRN